MKVNEGKKKIKKIGEIHAFSSRFNRPNQANQA
jgi:hypothetical protein